MSRPENIVGIGTSAGGIEAIEDFFNHMPSDSKLAFVIIQHPSPDFKSMVPDLLKKNTEMKTFRAKNGMEVFKKVHGIYQIDNSIRNKIVFIKKNILVEPTFANLDQISYLNLSINFKKTSQDKVLQKMNFGLKKDGFLFFGPNVNLGVFENAFNSDYSYFTATKKSTKRKCQ